MKRRSFLAGGMAAVASSAIPRRACPADDIAARQRWAWKLSDSTSEYVIRLRGPAVTCDCYALDAAGDDDPDVEDPDDGAPADGAMVATGAERRPTSWEVVAWHQPDERTVRVALSAVDLPLTADLLFEIDRSTGLLVRRTTLRHRGTGPDVDVTATLAFWCQIHEPVESIRHLAGAWAQETQIRRGRGDAPLLLESRSGKTGFGGQPYVALRTGAATYLCQIFWSGNWMLHVVPRPGGASLYGGLNDWQFRHRLHPTGSLVLPMVLFGRFEGTLNTATQRLHDYRRAHRPDPDRPIPVQFNSWYPYQGEPTAAAMLTLVPHAKRLGCEAFVVDAGWYETDDGQSGTAWMAATGDWRASRDRFPGGLREVSAACRRAGLRFGLWFEPEVIGPLSAIRRDHPEWLHHVDGRVPAADERAVLNLGVPGARRHAFGRVTRILSAAGVGWMKWDFNADLGQGGWAPGLPKILTDQDPLVAHYEGLYRLQDAIRRWFPELILEMCAGGGGRMDGELLSHAHVNWISDQPGPLRKLAIHVGSQLAHPAVVCNDWLVEWPPGSIAGYDNYGAAGHDERGDLPFRLRVAMLGSFGISARIDRWTDTDFAIAAEHVGLYRETLRPIIHHGDQYLLTRAPPAEGDGDWMAVWYVAKDGSAGVLFAFRLDSQEASRVFALPGLRPDRRYRATRFSGERTDAAGEALAAGLAVTVPDRFRSELCIVEAG